MTFRLNLNTVDYSEYDNLTLLVKLNTLRLLAYGCVNELDASDYADKAEDVWSILYNRKKSDADQFVRIEELFELADRGQLDTEDLACLEEGFLP